MYLVRVAYETSNSSDFFWGCTGIVGAGVIISIAIALLAR